MDTLKKNEEIARKFRVIETALSSACSPPELLGTLVRQLGREFHVPYIWLTFVRRDGQKNLLSCLELPECLREQVGVLDAEAFDEVLPQKTVPVLANENLRPFYKLFPESRKFFLKSVAVVPLSLQGEFQGSLNLGDASPERYSAGMDTSLLQQLGEKISERLEQMLYSGREALSEPVTGLNCGSPVDGVSKSE